MWKQTREILIPLSGNITICKLSEKGTEKCFSGKGNDHAG